MNINLQAGETETAKPCLIERVVTKRGSKPKASFAELAAEYRAFCIIGNDLTTDNETSEKYFNKAYRAVQKMTLPDVRMTEQDRITLARLIREECERDPGGTFNCSITESLVMKLVDSIVASGTAISEAS
jgi:hypothetical protein